MPSVGLDKEGQPGSRSWLIKALQVPVSIMFGLYVIRRDLDSESQDATKQTRYLLIQGYRCHTFSMYLYVIPGLVQY
jgi:CRISPR/Cas system-associated protein endoribonuclease Cas2